MDDTRERMEVRHCVQEAIGMFQREGKEETLSKISDPHGPFIQGERYVFALSPGGNLIAHPFSKTLLDKNLTTQRDSEGKSFIRKLLETANSRGYGYVEYKWPSPGSIEDLHKILFFERVDGMILCSGFYTEKESPFESFVKYFRPCGPA